MDFRQATLVKYPEKEQRLEALCDFVPKLREQVIRDGSGRRFAPDLTELVMENGRQVAASGDKPINVGLDDSGELEGFYAMYLDKGEESLYPAVVECAYEAMGLSGEALERAVIEGLRAEGSHYRVGGGENAEPRLGVRFSVHPHPRGFRVDMALCCTLVGTVKPEQARNFVAAGRETHNSLTDAAFLAGYGESISADA